MADFGKSSINTVKVFDRVKKGNQIFLNTIIDIIMYTLKIRIINYIGILTLVPPGVFLLSMV